MDFLTGREEREEEEGEEEDKEEKEELARVVWMDACPHL